MTDVSVLGLGLMGSALARALVRSGQAVTVWNRSAGKITPLEAQGAKGTTSVAAAVSASPVVIVCLDSYATTRGLIDRPDVAQSLAGRTIVQLSTGTPREATESELWLRGHSVRYLDGAILAGPAQVDSTTATVLYAGDRAAFDRSKSLLSAFGEDARFVGERIGTAAALDLAWLSQCFGEFMGVAHGVALCQSEGVDLDLFSALFPKGHGAHYILKPIARHALANPGAFLRTWNTGLQRILAQAVDAGISPDVPQFIGTILDRAEAQGFGDEHIAAIAKVLRRPAG